MSELNEFVVTPIDIDGVTAGATVVRGPEFHFISFGERKVISPKLIAQCLQPIIDQHGYVKTRTPKDDTRQRRFNLLIGFDIETEDEFYTHFKLERLNLRGVKTCLS